MYILVDLDLKAKQCNRNYVWQISVMKMGSLGSLLRYILDIYIKLFYLKT